MQPVKQTVFLPITELEKYNDEVRYFCSAIVFSPETESNHFEGCPPYISISSNEKLTDIKYFEIPRIVACYAKTHSGYTLSGLERMRQKGERDLASKIKKLLNIDYNAE